MSRGRNRIVAWLAAVAATFLAQIAVLAALSSSLPIRIFVPLAAGVAMGLGAAAFAVYAPLLALLRRLGPVGPFSAGAVCAALFPLAQIALWLLVRESDESWRDFVDAFRGHPGEIFTTGVPLALGGILYGFLSSPRRERGE